MIKLRLERPVLQIQKWTKTEPFVPEGRLKVVAHARVIVTVVVIAPPIGTMTGVKAGGLCGPLPYITCHVKDITWIVICCSCL